MSTFKYKAFISYSHADSEWAEWLLNGLERYKVPRKLVGKKTDKGLVPANLSPIFRDRDELPAAGKMTERLFEALAQSEFLLVICSPRSAQSKLVNKEIAEFKRLHGDDHILCMIVDGSPFSGDASRECFPEALLHHFHTDGMKAGLSAEGLAADVRPEGDGRQMGLNKIIAGLLGVGLNDIVQRETQRRNRKLFAGAVVAATSVAVMGGLTYNAMTAQQEAERLAHIADAKSEESQRRLEDNENLSLFVMTAVFEEVLRHGSLESVERVTRQLLQYYEDAGPDTMSEGHLFGFTAALMRLGQLYDRRGESDKAQEVFESTLLVSREFLAENPKSSKALHRLQNNLFFVGYLADRQGRLEVAEAAFRERLELVMRGQDWPRPFIKASWKLAWQEDPRDFWREKRSDAQAYLARFLVRFHGKTEEAIALAHESMVTREQLLSKQEGNTEGLLSLGSSYLYLGDAYQHAGQLDKALAIFKKREDLFGGLLDEQPDNFQARRRLIVSREKIAGILALNQHFEAAAAIFKETSAGYRALTAKDPDSTLWLSESARSHMQLAKTLEKTGDIAGARTAAETGLAKITESIARDSTRPAHQLIKSQLELLETKLLHRTENAQAAQSRLQTLDEALSAKPAKFFTAVGAREHQADVAFEHGNLLAQQGDMEAAIQCWLKAVAAIQELPGTISPLAQRLLVQANRALAQNSQATAEAR